MADIKTKQPEPDTEIDPQEPPEQADYATWLAGQPEDVRTRIEANTTGLRSALQSERTERKRLEGEIRKTAKGLEADSETRQQLDTLTAQLQEADRRVVFSEAATAAGISNPKLAYVAAKDAGLLNDDGTPKLEQLRAQYPELFPQRRTPPANAGAGTQAGGTPAPSAGAAMNDFIRRSAGRGD